MANIWNTLTKELTPAQGRWVLAGLAAVVLLLAAIFGPTNQTNSSSESPTSSGSANTTVHDLRVTATEKEWEEIKKAEATMPQAVRNAEVGVTTTIIGPGASWPCAKSKADLSVLMKWYKISLADPDGPGGEAAFSQFSDLLVQGHGTSIMLEPRDRVKILAKETGIRKIAVVQTLKGSFVGSRAVTARGCWIAAEVVTR